MNRVSREDPLYDRRRLGLQSNIDWREGAWVRIGDYPRNDMGLTPKEAKARQIHRLPATAESFYNDRIEAFGWGPTLEAIFAGTRDENSPLSALRTHESTLVRYIHSYLANEWARYVNLTIPASCVGNMAGEVLGRFPEGRMYPAWQSRERAEDLPLTSSGPRGFVSYSRCGIVDFPEPTGRNVNMMPFVFGEKSLLPADLQCYHDLVEKCPYMQEEVGKVGYLTVHESYVEAGKAQRRQGLHIESPGIDLSDNDDEAAAFTPGYEHQWGQGVFFAPDRYQGGIFMASNVDKTSEIWDALIDKSIRGIVDRHGGCEHLRNLIGPGTTLQAGELIWMTDCTPHEALSQEVSGHRTFFRVVTSSVSHWYAKHSTPNPKVPLPDHVVVVQGSKF